MNGGGKCAVCGATQGAYDPAIELPRCKGLLAHVMYYHVPITLKQRLDAGGCEARICSDGYLIAHAQPIPRQFGDGEYPTADRPVSKRNPSWTF